MVSSADEIAATDLALNIEIGKKWDLAIQNLAKVLDVPVAIVFRKEMEDIKVISTNSDNIGNPFHHGDVIPIKGSFCNYVLEKNDEFRVPDINEIDLDINNVATQNDFISYLGFPLKWKNGEVFGTICLLDDKRNYYSDQTSTFLKSFRDLLTDSLAMIETNYDLQRQNEELVMKIEETQDQEGTIPFCPKCSRVKYRDHWIELSEYTQLSSDHPLFRDVSCTCNNYHHSN